MAAPVCGVQPGGAARGMPLPPPGRAAGRVTAGPQEARGGRAEPQRLDRTKAAFHRPPHRRAPNCLGEKFISERGAAFERAQRSVCGTRTAPAALGAAGGGRHCPLLAPGGCRGPYGTGTVRPSGARRARSPDPCSAPGICSPSIRALVFNQNSIRNMIPGDYIWRDLRYISCRRDRLQRSPGRAGGRDNLHLARLTFNKKGGKVIKNTSLKAPGGYLRACLSSIPSFPAPPSPRRPSGRCRDGSGASPPAGGSGRPVPAEPGWSRVGTLRCAPRGGTRPRRWHRRSGQVVFREPSERA